MSWYSSYNDSKTISYLAGVDAGTNYQVVVHVYKTSGTSGTEVLNGETVAKVYVGSKCRDDFNDIRFMSPVTFLPYKQYKTSYTSGAEAVFTVLVSDSMDSNQNIKMYYNNPLASIDVSDPTVFIDVVSGVVGAWTMNEALATDPVVDYSGNSNTGTPTGTAVVAGKWVGTYTRQAYNTDKIMLASSMTAWGANPFSMWGCVYITAYPASGNYLTLIGGTAANAPAFGIFSTSGILVLNNMGTSVTSSGLSVPLNQWVFIGVTCSAYNGEAVFYVDKTKATITMSAQAVPFASTNGLGTYLNNANRYFIGKEFGVGIASGVLSTSQMNNLSDYYSDYGLIVGSGCIRKWATTTLPTVDSVSAETPNWPDGGEKYYYYKKEKNKA
jgi:hypothetical protein